MFLLRKLSEFAWLNRFPLAFLCDLGGKPEFHLRSSAKSADRFDDSRGVDYNLFVSKTISQTSVEVTGDELVALDEALDQMNSTRDIPSKEFWKSIDDKMKEMNLRENASRTSR